MWSGRIVVRLSGPDLVEAAEEATSRLRPKRADELAIQVQESRSGTPHQRPGRHCATRPSLTVPGDPITELSLKRRCELAIELAVSPDVERREPVAWISGGGRLLIAEDDAAAGGLEPGLDGLVLLGVVDQIVGAG